MTNKLRGEVEIELSGEKWTLRPTFEALSNIESKLNKSIPEIVREQRNAIVKFVTIAVVIWEGMVAANEGRPPLSKTRNSKPLRYEEVGEMIVKDGLTNVIQQEGLMMFLLHGLAGDQKMLAAQEKADQEKVDQEKEDEHNPT